MSIRSSKIREAVNEVDELKLQNYLSSIISQNTISQSEPGLINSKSGLVERLLNLQVDLVSRINGLKRQKIAALEAYNHEYDRFSILSISHNTKDHKNLNHEHTQQSQPQQNINDDVNQELKAQERQLKNILSELYELKDKSNLQESLLTCQQLQHLSHLLKHQPKSLPNHLGSFQNLNSEKDFLNLHFNQLKEEEQTIIKKKSQKKFLQSSLQNQPSAMAWLEEIQMLKQVMEKLMNIKLSCLKFHQQLITRYQSQSKQKVKEMLNKRLFLEKQLDSLNKTINNLSLCYRFQTQSSSSPNIQTQTLGQSQREKADQPYSKYLNAKKSKPFSIEKWQNILKYKQIKQKLQQVQKSLHNNCNTHGFPPSQPQTNSQSKSITPQQQPKQPLKQYQISQLTHDAIKAKVNMYQKFIIEQNHNKQELCGQIKRKKQQYDQLKRQNQLMNQIIINSHL